VELGTKVHEFDMNRKLRLTASAITISIASLGLAGWASEVTAADASSELKAGQSPLLPIRFPATPSQSSWANSCLLRGARSAMALTPGAANTVPT
jgi:hypothetical protein